MIRVSGLIFEYPGVRALEDVSFHIPKGSITALVGPNGAGKTTLLRCIATLEKPLAGEIEVAGINALADPRGVHGQLGYLSDSFGAYDELTVRQNIAYMARAQQIPPAEAPARVEKVIELLELSRYASARAGTLSRGWRQRLGMAMVMVHDPELLLLDEPASGLDPEARASLSHLMKSLQRAGKTLVVSSHILAELEDYCTDMLVLREGRIRAMQRNLPEAGKNAAPHRQLNIRLLQAKQRKALEKLLTPHLAEGTAFRGTDASLQAEIRLDDKAAAALLKAVVEKNIGLLEWRLETPSLQDAYLSLAEAGSKPAAKEGRS